MTGGPFLPSSCTIPSVRLHEDCSYWVLFASALKILIVSLTKDGRIESCELQASYLTGKVNERRVQSVALPLGTAQDAARLHWDGDEVLEIMTGIGSRQLYIAKVNLSSGNASCQSVTTRSLIIDIFDNDRYVLLDDYQLFQVQESNSPESPPSLKCAGSPVRSSPISCSPSFNPTIHQQRVCATSNYRSLILEENDGNLTEISMALPRDLFLSQFKETLYHGGNTDLLFSSTPPPTLSATIEILDQLPLTSRKSLIVGLLMKMHQQAPYGPLLKSFWWVCHFWEIALGSSLNMSAVMAALEGADVEAVAKVGFMLPAYGALVELSIETVVHVVNLLSDSTMEEASAKARLYRTSLFHSRLVAVLTLLASIVRNLRSLVAEHERKGHVSPLTSHFYGLATRMEGALVKVDIPAALQWLQSISNEAKQSVGYIFDSTGPLIEPAVPNTVIRPTAGAISRDLQTCKNITNTRFFGFDDCCPGCLNWIQGLTGAGCLSGPSPFWKLYWSHYCPCGTPFRK